MPPGGFFGFQGEPKVALFRLRCFCLIRCDDDFADNRGRDRPDDIF